MIRRCAWCGRCSVDGEWTRIPEPDRRELEVTDGICPSCAERYDEELDLLERREIR